MREIKFRAWDGSKMHYNTVPFAKNDNGTILCIGSRGFRNNEQNIETSKDCNAYEIMQYTGRKDRKGREIYENDYLKIDNSSRWVVLWDNEKGSFYVKSLNTGIKSRDIYGTRHSEICGNVFENEGAR